MDWNDLSEEFRTCCYFECKRLNKRLTFAHLYGNYYATLWFNLVTDSMLMGGEI